jgi:hypothetical protein
LVEAVREIWNKNEVPPVPEDAVKLLDRNLPIAEWANELSMENFVAGLKKAQQSTLPRPSNARKSRDRR